MSGLLENFYGLKSNFSSYVLKIWYYVCTTWLIQKL